MRSGLVFRSGSLLRVTILLAAAASMTACSKKDATPESINISAIVNITGVSAVCKGTVSRSVNDSLESLGVCFSTSPAPTIQSSVRTYPYGAVYSEISIQMDQLLPATKYYVRAFVSDRGSNYFYSNELSFMTDTFHIGSSVPEYQGTVFYLDSTGHHGLIAAAEDFGSWIWNADPYMVTSATSLLDGKLNTDIIISHSAYPFYGAVGACWFYRYDQIKGNHDWFLPAKDQLTWLFNNKDAVGGFSGIPYWSSTEIDSTHAWTLDFTNGVAGAGDKLTSYGVKAIRAF